ncbi:MAG: tail fiber domain-containing protein [Candidatus Sumerlaeota bacterium]
MLKSNRQFLPLILSSFALLISLFALFSIPSSSTSPNNFQPSSRRWKQNVNPLVGSLERVKQLQGVSYTWDKDHGGFRDMGFIAEDVHQIVPEVVKMEPNSANAESLDYGHMTALLVESVKELSKQNDSLRMQLDQQKKDIQVFQNRMNGTVMQPHR